MPSTLTSYLPIGYGLFLFCFLLIACKKEDPALTPLEQLPPLTFEGKNTFGCLIDGGAWVAKVPPLSGLGGSCYQRRMALFI